MINAKKRFWTVLALFVAMVLCLSLALFAGCGSNEEKNGEGENAGDPDKPVPPVAVITVTLDSRGGGNFDALTYTDKALTLPTPSKENFDFVGWFDNADCTGSATPSSYVPTRDITLYAGWTEKTTPPEPPKPLDPSAFVWRDKTFDKSDDGAAYTANDGDYASLHYRVSEESDETVKYKLSQFNTVAFEYRPGGDTGYNTDFSAIKLVVKNERNETFAFAVFNKFNRVAFMKDDANIAVSTYASQKHAAGEWGDGDAWYSVTCALAANNAVFDVDGQVYYWDYTQGMDLSGELEWYFESEFHKPGIRNIVFSATDIEDMPEPEFKHNGYNKTVENGETVYTAATVDGVMAYLPSTGAVTAFEFSVRPNELPDNCWDQNYVAFSVVYADSELLFQFLNYYKLLWVRPFANNVTGSPIIEERYVDAEQFTPGWNAFDEWYDITLSFTAERIDVYVNGVLRGSAEDHGYTFDENTRYAIRGYNNLSSLKGLKLYYADKNTVEEKEALRAYLNSIDIDGYDQAEYTAESFATFTESLASAAATLKKDGATAEELNATRRALQSALTGLTVKPERLTPLLRQKIDDASALPAEEYTADSFEALTAAVQEASALIDGESATSEQLLAEIRKLDGALEALVRIWEPSAYERTHENDELVYTPATAGSLAGIVEAEIGYRGTATNNNTFEFSMRPNVYADAWDQNYVGVSVKINESTELLIAYLHYYKLIRVFKMPEASILGEINWELGNNGWTNTTEWFDIKVFFEGNTVRVYLNGTFYLSVDLTGTFTVPQNAQVRLISILNVASVKNLSYTHNDKEALIARDELSQYIARVEADVSSESDYTSESYAAFQAALGDAKAAIAGDATAAELIEAKTALQEKFDGLRYNTAGLVADIRAKLDSAAALDKEEYTSDSFTALGEATVAAETALANENATVDELTAVSQNLDDAISGLVRLWESANYGKTRDADILVYTPTNPSAVSSINYKPGTSDIDTIEFSFRPNAYANVWDMCYIGFSLKLNDNTQLLVTILHFYKLIWVRPEANGAVGGSICTYPSADPRTVDNYDPAVHNG